MTVLNPIDDNEAAYAAWFNAFANAHGAGGIISGCSISKGSGDWDIDVTSGQITEGNTEASISSDTKTLTQPSNDADMDAGESRIDLIHADTGDSISVTEGTAGSNPATPDIPSSEVLLGFVVVAESDSTVADSDIHDIPALLQDNSALYELNGSHQLSIPPTLINADARPYSTNDTLSDVSQHTVSITTDTTTELINVSGSGVCLGGVIWGDQLASNDITMNIDGAGSTGIQHGTPSGAGDGITFLPPVVFDSSLVTTINPGSAPNILVGMAVTR